MSNPRGLGTTAKLLSQFQCTLDETPDAHGTTTLIHTARTPAAALSLLSHFNYTLGQVANTHTSPWLIHTARAPAAAPRLLSQFQHTLDEITLIANPTSAANLGNGHRACEMRSYVDPLKGENKAGGLDTGRQSTVQATRNRQYVDSKRARTADSPL